ncbi:MAG: hypothetical protein AB7P94_16770 [Steroidobacteraceae bacterium]
MSAAARPAVEDMDAVVARHGRFVDSVNDLAMAFQDDAYAIGRRRGFQEGASADVLQFKAEAAKLRGEREVLKLLLILAIDVVRNVEAEGSSEAEQLAKLIEKTDAALLELAKTQASGGSSSSTRPRTRSRSPAQVRPSACT